MPKHMHAGGDSERMLCVCPECHCEELEDCIDPHNDRCHCSGKCCLEFNNDDLNLLTQQKELVH